LGIFSILFILAVVFLFYFVSINVIFLWLSIPFCLLLTLFAAKFSKKDMTDSSNERVVDLQEHTKELKEFIFRKIELKQTSYEKLEQISRIKEQVPEEFLENMINEVHKFFVKEGDIKC
jgi:hypothetical protein